ncbi:MAG TPA: hypothetical protein VFG54_20665 [Prolixibacteraceae bacterium]|nr:hypothetical protein [Prolixibacteraceae bacterium]
MKKNLYLVFAIIIFTLIYSCDNDQVEKKYKDYNSAFNSGIFDAKWIPEELISKDMSNIYLRTNIDINTCFFAYSTKDSNVDSISRLLSSIKCHVKKPMGIDVPRELLTQAERLDFYLLKQKDMNDSVFIAVDKNAKMILGLRK